MLIAVFSHALLRPFINLLLEKVSFALLLFITVIGTLGILLNAIYFLRAYQRVFLGQLNERCKEYTDINNLELLAVIPLAIVVLLFGVYPAPLIDLISPAVENIIAIIQSVN